MGTDIFFFNVREPKPLGEVERLFMQALSDVGASLEPQGSIINTLDDGYVSWSGIHKDDMEGTVTLGRFFSPEVSRLLYAIALRTEWAMFLSIENGFMLRPLAHAGIPVTREGFDPLPETIESPEALHSLFLKVFEERAKFADEVRENIIRANQQRDKH
jgi:hypothetical protein